jgi:hypothetical protein
MKPTVPPEKMLPRNEWDFRPRPEKAKKKGDWTGGQQFDFLPDDEVELCWEYEFTRLSGFGSVSGDYYLKWRARADNPHDFDSLLAHYWRTDPSGKLGYPPVNFYMVWPEWPEQPFLSVTQKERERRHKAMWRKNLKRQLPTVPLRDIYRLGVALKTGEQTDLLKSIPEMSYRRIEVEDDVLILRSILPGDEEPPAEIAAFVIDYTLGDKILAKRFQNWLVQRRKEKGYARQEHRGKSGTKRARADLCALGGWRLLRSGLSIKEAQDYTEKVSGKALFSDAGDWSKAKKKAVEALHDPL